MAKLVFLGTGSAVAYQDHETTHMAVVGEQSAFLIDCGSRPVQRLDQAGIKFQDLDALIITHFHADHAAALPNLIMDMWLLGRKREFQIYGLPHTITRARALLELFDWGDWPGLYPVQFTPLPEVEGAPVLDTGEFKVFSSPVKHLVPTLGLRVEHQESSYVLAYSADTEPVDEMVRLGRGADLLVHEAGGPAPNHSSALEAGEIAARAEAKQLALIHYHQEDWINRDQMLQDAKKTFPGKVFIAEDWMEIPLPG